MKTNNNDLINKIYSETLNLIFNYGAKGWTMDTVCEKCGIAKDTLYRVISNKENLIQDALLKMLDEHSKEMIDLLSHDEDYFNTLKRIAIQLSNFLEQFSLDKLSQIFLAYPSVEITINNEMEVFFQKFERFLDKGKNRGLLKKDLDSKLFVKILQTCVMQFLKQPKVFNATKDTELLLDYLVEGIKT